MPHEIIEQIRQNLPIYRAIRQDIHSQPELGFAEHKTVQVICDTLNHLGIEYHKGIGRTGIVASIRGQGKPGAKAIGLRADMDALPIHERTELEYVSQCEGKMHACGHDGHVAMVLAAAEYLQRSRQFAGTVYLIFQPGEEGYNGALEMVNDGLFSRFPIEQVFALHNWPDLPLGVVSVPAGPVMAAADGFRIHIQGKGGHGGVAPHQTIDPVLIAGHVITSIHSIVSRNISPLDAGVISIGGIAGGSLAARSVIPDDVTIVGTVRSLRPEVRSMLESRLRETVEGVVSAFGGNVSIEYKAGVPATINSEPEAALAQKAAEELVGRENVVQRPVPSLGGEDFAFMLLERPGAYIHLGTGDAHHRHGLHTARFDFNDEAIPVGAALLARIAELSMPLKN